VLKGLRIVSAYGERRLVGAPVPDRREFGVPPGGPFDRLSAALANALLRLPESLPCLEIAMGPVVFEAMEPLTVAVVGGPDGTFSLVQGERLEVRPIGARAYVAVAETGPRRRLADPPRFGEEPVRVLPGPQANLFDIDRFQDQTYTVGNASNRIGVRLEGVAMPHAIDLPSEPAIPGVVQLPPNGQPIVLGPDGPTIGGYPKVAVVIESDLDQVGRMRPGHTVRFVLVNLDEAREACRFARQGRERRCAELRVTGLGQS
jgi:allophanate hydrolase subunit 2